MSAPISQEKTTRLFQFLVIRALGIILQSITQDSELVQSVNSWANDAKEWADLL